MTKGWVGGLWGLGVAKKKQVGPDCGLEEILITRGGGGALSSRGGWSALFLWWVTIPEWARQAPLSSQFISQDVPVNAYVTPLTRVYPRKRGAYVAPNCEPLRTIANHCEPLVDLLKCESYWNCHAPNSNPIH